MQIVNMKIADIHPYEKNPRFNDDAVEAVAKSIKEFGWRSPIVVDKDYVIVCGHTSYKAAQQLGLAEIPVHVAKELTPQQIQAYRIADNKTAEIAEWNYELLPLELQELQDAEFDLSLLGFDSDELEKILNGGDDKTVLDGETEPDTVPEIPEEAVSCAGEVYQLDDHLLICGDAANSEDYAKLMNEDKADLYLTDPPYNVKLEGSNGLTIMNDNIPDGDFRELLDSSFTNARTVLKPGAAFYIFHSDSESANFRLACKGAELPVHETLYWVKNALVLSRFDYHYKSESILYGWKEGAAHNWYSDRCQTNILEFNKAKANDVHPSMKPVEMLVYLIQNSTKRGDTVLDNFGGSGSTLIACEQTNRKCRMLELDPKYCDVIRKRWAEFKYGEGCDWEAKTPVWKPELVEA
jgi:DNA modification methylase